MIYYLTSGTHVYVVSIIHIKGRVHTVVWASRAPLLQLRACVIFTGQVIAIQLRGQPAVSMIERSEGRLCSCLSLARAAINHRTPPAGRSRDGTYKASFSPTMLGKWANATLNWVRTISISALFSCINLTCLLLSESNITFIHSRNSSWTLWLYYRVLV